jgi:hypothetical protein
MSDASWRPAASVELAPLELMDLVEAHLRRARTAAARGQAEVQQFHEDRAAELRQRVASLAPHLLTPGGTAIA